jgi:rhomboid protease GluP
MFALEMARGGSEDPQTLIDLGALWPPLVTLGGEYWRLIAPAFLHFGPVHFGGNALMLAGLGAVIERIYGSPRMALIYFVGAIGSATFVLLAMHFDFIDEGFFVGASGAIFALLGAEAAWVLWKWRARRLSRDLAGVFSILGVVVFQVGFDALVPVASTAGHLSGFASGFLAGALILRFWPLRPQNERRAQGRQSADQQAPDQ